MIDFNNVYNKSDEPYSSKDEKVINTFSSYFSNIISEDVHSKIIESYGEKQSNFKGDYWQLTLLLLSEYYSKNIEDKNKHSAWNKWRNNSKDIIHLEECNLTDTDLKNANLENAYLHMADLSRAKGNATLILKNAKLENAKLCYAEFNDVKLGNACLKGAVLKGTELKGAILSRANLEIADLTEAILTGAKLVGANLNGAILSNAYLDKANLHSAEFYGANINDIYIDDETNLCHIKFDRELKCSNFDINIPKADVRVKEQLRYIIRKYNWQDWYKRHPIRRCLVNLFWWCSDYGYSTKRTICSFILIAIFFAIIYLFFGYNEYFNNGGYYQENLGIVNNLFTLKDPVTPKCPNLPVLKKYKSTNHICNICRAIYFSIVTMTTLGYGDIDAVEDKIMGHVCIVTQVLLGYILLGLLVTRFAILLTTDRVIELPPKNKSASNKT